MAFSRMETDGKKQILPDTYNLLSIITEKLTIRRKAQE